MIRLRAVLASAASVITVIALAACAGMIDGRTTSGSGSPGRTITSGNARAVSTAFPLGTGFVRFPDTTSAWVAAHPHDPRDAAFRKYLLSHTASLWLTGNESFGNLHAYAAAAKARKGAMLLTLWNAPYRWDGLSAASQLSVDQYLSWVRRVAAGIGTLPAVIVLEPDALWFYDRLPTDAARAQRLAALKGAISILHSDAPHAHVYLDAGTASGSVTPGRMAQLLVAAGLHSAAGYAVNVSSYAPAGRIDAYAQQIRTALRHRGVADPRFVIDTGRNGAATWSNNWCNPPSQLLGQAPGRVWSSTGLDMRLWIKAPGTSDGDCGVAGYGKGSYGGQFLARLAYRMIKNR